MTVTLSLNDINVPDYDLIPDFNPEEVFTFTSISKGIDLQGGIPKGASFMTALPFGNSMGKSALCQPKHFSNGDLETKTRTNEMLNSLPFVINPMSDKDTDERYRSILITKNRTKPSMIKTKLKQVISKVLDIQSNDVFEQIHK